MRPSARRQANARLVVEGTAPAEAQRQGRGMPACLTTCVAVRGAALGRFIPHTAPVGTAVADASRLANNRHGTAPARTRAQATTGPRLLASRQDSQCSPRRPTLLDTTKWPKRAHGRSAPEPARPSSRRPLSNPAKHIKRDDDAAAPPALSTGALIAIHYPPEATHPVNPPVMI